MNDTQIRVLDADTINKIAAGEVIERPASVVKELLENAIDAGADAVTVEAADGGKKLIRVTDNGAGIPAEQVPTAFLRHATSKIRSADDLETVGSLGFRGEALSSIAAVARVELITRTAESLYGLRYVIEDGTERESEAVGAPAGTTFLVRDLFAHVPARKKFLASDQTEAAAIADMAEKVAIAHPEVSIRLILNGKLRFMTTGSGKLSDVIYAILGREISKEMLPAAAAGDGIAVAGFVGKPSVSRGNRGFELFSVNGRTVRSRLLTEALEEGFYGHLMMHKYPVAVLDVTVDPLKIDVNVHPAKLEVRFADEKAVRACLTAAVRQALAQGELITKTALGPDEPAKKPQYPDARRTAGSHEPFESHLNAKQTVNGPLPADRADGAEGEQTSQQVPQAHSVAVSPAPAQEETDCNALEAAEAQTVTDGACVSEDAANAAAGPSHSATFTAERAAYTADVKETPAHRTENIPLAEAPEQQELPGARLLSPENRKDFKLLGIAFDTYLLVQAGSDFLMIDQHAAHEKVLYERFMKEFSAHAQTSQQCAPPMVFTVNSAEEAVLQQNMAQFQALGFEIEPFGGRDYALYAVPANMLSLARADVFLELLDGMAAEGTAVSRLVHDRIAKMACKAAVKGLDPLSVPEAEALIGELLSLQDPYTCPHGRPTTVLMSLEEIEKKFKRIVS